MTDDPTPRSAAPAGHRSQVLADVPGLQFERTSLAWERTAIATMVAGVGLVRLAARAGHWFLASIGVVQVVVGAVILLWATVGYQRGHATVTERELAAPRATRVVGLGSVVFIGSALAMVVLDSLPG